MIKDARAACEKYAKDNSDVHGQVLTCHVVKEFNDEFEFTSNVWEVGIPVSKMFDRNEPVPLFVPAGTDLTGVAYVGRRSGADIFEFAYGQAWYRAYVNLGHLMSPENVLKCADGSAFVTIDS